MYLAAGQELPTFEECGDFEQIENGVGLFRRFEHDFMNALEDLPTAPRMREFDSVSGVFRQHRHGHGIGYGGRYN